MTDQNEEPRQEENPLPDDVEELTDEELEIFGKALKRLDSDQMPSPDFTERLMEKVSRRWPVDGSAIDRVNAKRKQNNQERDGRS